MAPRGHWPAALIGRRGHPAPRCLAGAISGAMTVEVCEAFRRNVAVMPWWLDGNIWSFRTFR